jgi:tight adherence protein C
MPAETLVIVGGVFVAVAAVAGLLGIIGLERLSPERRRLDAIAAQRSLSIGIVEASPLAQNSDAAHALARFVPRSPKEMGRIRRQLAMGGYHGALPATIYGLAELAFPILFGGTALVLMGLRGGIFVALIAAVIGYLVPGVFLSRIVANFKKEIRNGLPDALDLLIVCVEAGSGLDQALIKATEELQVSYPRLSMELAMITTEIRAGKPWLEAFKNFADRTKVEDVQSLVSMLLQTDRFGTSIAQALRTQADVQRTKRRQRAEEKAAKLGVKLVFPLVLCLFPALYVVTLGPAVLKVVRVLGPVIKN